MERYESKRSPHPSLEALSHTCTIEKDDFGQDAFILSFSEKEAVTTIRIEFNDWQSGADLVITNMTTLPIEGLDEKQIRKGYGSTAIKKLLEWAQGKGLTNIQAVQVLDGSERFWESNGFVKMNNATNDFIYTKATA